MDSVPTSATLCSWGSTSRKEGPYGVGAEVGAQNLGLSFYGSMWLSEFDPPPSSLNPGCAGESARPPPQ